MAITSAPTLNPDLNARRLLLPLVAGLIVLSAIVQLIVALGDNQIRLGSILMTVVVALFYGGFMVVRRNELDKIRFARLVAHATTYAIVVGSFQLHAAFLSFTNSDALRGDANVPLDPGWFGPTFAMAGFWAIGLVIHAIASISQRGFENYG